MSPRPHPDLPCAARLYGAEADRTLGELFARRLGPLTDADLAAECFDAEDLLARGWIARAPGRWSSGYVPAGPVLDHYAAALAARGVHHQPATILKL